MKPRRQSRAPAQTLALLEFEGHWDTVKRCQRCEKIHAHLVEERSESDEWPNDRLDCGHGYEEMHGGEAPPDEIAALAFALPGDDL